MAKVGEDGLTGSQRYYRSHKQQKDLLSSEFQKSHRPQINAWYREWYAKNREKVCQQKKEATARRKAAKKAAEQPKEVVLDDKK
jgi:hypothetical protein